MTEPRTRPSIAEICDALMERVWPQEGVTFQGCYEMGATTRIFVHVDDGDAITFRFEDMPRIAEAFGTDKLWFSSSAGASASDSVTFDGQLLVIEAEYAQPDDARQDYERGRRFAEGWIEQGGALDSEGPDTTNEDYYRGFVERLAEARAERRTSR